MGRRKNSRATLPALVIHAGAGKLPESPILAERMKSSLREIAAGLFSRLQRSSALECVVWAVTQMEDDPQFNAGTGAKLQSDGVPRLTAAVMDGDTHRFSGVINIERVK